MIRAGWKILIASALASASLALYTAFYALHPDRAVVADWFLGSLAFLPVQILIVTVIVDGLLGRRERQARLKKLNMVIEDYPHLFSLAARTNPFDPRADIHVKRAV